MPNIAQLHWTFVGLVPSLTKRASLESTHSVEESRNQVRFLHLLRYSTRDNNAIQIVRASVNELPVEVLANIFEGCVERETRKLSPQMFRSYLYGIPKGSPPLLFLQVCRYWREVALSTS